MFGKYIYVLNYFSFGQVMCPAWRIPRGDRPPAGAKKGKKHNGKSCFQWPEIKISVITEYSHNFKSM